MATRRQPKGRQRPDTGVEMGRSSPPRATRDRDADSARADAGAKLLVDGREAVVHGYREGYFVRPTVLTGVPAEASWRRRRSSVRC